ncbi:MAG: histidine kinase dimerization/phospho-acceptor domain-containing protein, partial [Nannocystaceae bacterium]
MKTEKKLHRLLQRQLRRTGIQDPSVAPSAEEWAELLTRISRTYAGNEEDRYLLERSLDISSQEMRELYEQLRTASESRIAAERDRLESILAAIGDGLCVLDKEGRIVSINPAALTLLGQPEEQLLGELALTNFSLAPESDERDGAEQPVDSLFAEAGASTIEDLQVLLLREQADDPLFAVLSGQSLRFERGYLRRASAESIPVACKLDPLVQHGEVAGIVFMFRDMTFERSVENKLHNLTMRLRTARDTALDASRTKSSFLATMSHELRTPLNAIIGYSDMIAEEADDYDLSLLRQDIARIQDAGEHLHQLINDILDISKIEAGKMEVFCERFEVADIVRSVANTIGPLMDRSGNTFVLDSPADLGEIHTDRTKLRQALLNLLSNASKFTKQGTCTLTVRAFDLDGASWMRFDVRDTGIGIPTNKIESLF